MRSPMWIAAASIAWQLLATSRSGRAEEKKCDGTVSAQDGHAAITVRITYDVLLGDPIQTGTQALQRLTLAAHNMKEERTLYPMTDQAAGNDRARDDLVKRLQAS